MKKGISITLHTITFVLLGLTIAVTVLMYFNNQNKYEEYDKEIEELKERNESLTKDLNKYSASSKNETNNEENNEQHNEEKLTYDISKFDKIKLQI